MKVTDLKTFYIYKDAAFIASASWWMLQCTYVTFGTSWQVLIINPLCTPAIAHVPSVSIPMQGCQSLLHSFKNSSGIWKRYLEGFLLDDKIQYHQVVAIHTKCMPIVLSNCSENCLLLHTCFTKTSSSLTVISRSLCDTLLFERDNSIV
jgi:hypothetical protein